MTSGGTGMFAAVSLNLMGKTKVADYVVTGKLTFKQLSKFLSTLRYCT